jgi:hypothetical protein
MKFVRDASEPDLPEHEGVEIRELAEGEGESFGAIACLAASVLAGFP